MKLDRVIIEDFVHTRLEPKSKYLSLPLLLEKTILEKRQY